MTERSVPTARARGGFDVVLGNPPWERIKLQEQEWFASHGRPDIAGARTAAIRGKLIKELPTSDPDLHRSFLEDRRKAEGESHLIRDGSGIDSRTGDRWGMFPLCGRGDVNTYSLFAELNRNLINPTGRVGCIVPTGIATDDTTKFFFQDLVEKHAIESYFGFKNERFLFPKPVEHTVTYGLLTMLGSGQATESMEFCWNVWTVEEMYDPERRVVLTADDLQQMNPNTRTCPVFRTAKDAELTKAIYRRAPVLLRENAKDGDPWGIRFMAMFHMTNDSGLFHAGPDLEADAWTLHRNIFQKGDAEYLPLYEAKMLHQFDHRWATYDGAESRDVNIEEKGDPNFVAIPRFWVPAGEVAARLKDRWDRRWLISWRDICRNTDIRTAIAGILPRMGVGNKAPLLLPKGTARDVVGFYALLSTFVFDYVSRQKMGGVTLNFFIVRQLPIFPPTTYAQQSPCDKGQILANWITPRVLELTYTAWDLEAFAQDCGYHGPPFRWDEERRFLLRAELDAAFFHLYLRADEEGDWIPARQADGCPHDESPEDLARLRSSFPKPRDAAGYIMDTFPIVRRKDEEKHDGDYRTKRVILEIYDQMHQSIRTGQAYQTRLDPPPGPPVDAAGNFVSPEDTGPADWPPHIHPLA